ncbi:unnamed protein product [Oikopleura dioica]|uniref:Uncharacterized protein n=1 Tax=Oikopleura dioica TaxID=34765 RepID=E4XJW0_OIKDI|nr:unnamed protein product [Oikopleura dioica]
MASSTSSSKISTSSTPPTAVDRSSSSSPTKNGISTDSEPQTVRLPMMLRSHELLLATLRAIPSLFDRTKSRISTTTSSKTILLLRAVTTRRSSQRNSTSSSSRHSRISSPILNKFPSFFFFIKTCDRLSPLSFFLINSFLATKINEGFTKLDILYCNFAFYKANKRCWWS